MELSMRLHVRSACESASTRNPVQEILCVPVYAKKTKRCGGSWTKNNMHRAELKNIGYNLSDSKDGPEPSPQLESSSCKGE